MRNTIPLKKVGARLPPPGAIAVTLTILDFLECIDCVQINKMGMVDVFLPEGVLSLTGADRRPLQFSIVVRKAEDKA